MPSHFMDFTEFHRFLFSIPTVLFSFYSIHSIPTFDNADVLFRFSKENKPPGTRPPSTPTYAGPSTPPWNPRRGGRFSESPIYKSGPPAGPFHVTGPLGSYERAPGSPLTRSRYASGPFCGFAPKPTPPPTTPTAPCASIVLMQTVPPPRGPHFGAEWGSPPGPPCCTALCPPPIASIAAPPLPSNATALAPGPSASPLAQGPFPSPCPRNGSVVSLPSPPPPQ